MPGPIIIHSDSSEQLRYNFPEYPLYSRYGEMKEYGYSALCHWHPDLEYLYMLTGTMDYFVNGAIVPLRQGQGIFVNSARLHYGFSKENRDSTFVSQAIHPSVFTQNTQPGQDYMDRKFSPNNVDYLLLSPEVSWQKELLQEMTRFHEAMSRIEEDFPEAMARALRMVELTGSHISDAQKKEADVRGMDSFLKMTSYISDHYPEKVSLDEIAAAGAVSRSKACRLFQNFIHQTPFDYLKQYRVEKSAALLRDTSLSVSEISWRCGFSSPSYYTSVFHEQKGKTPKEYRRFIEN